MEITLDRLGLCQQAVVTHIDTKESLKRRLCEYGMVPGTVVRCRYRSPGGSVMALEFRGSVVAMRTRDAKGIRAQVQ